MAPDASALHYDAPSSVETTLHFFVPDGEKPKVLMADDYTQENRRTGTFRGELVTIHNGRRAHPAPVLDREGFELVEQGLGVEHSLYLPSARPRSNALPAIFRC